MRGDMVYNNNIPEREDRGGEKKEKRREERKTEQQTRHNRSGVNEVYFLG